MEYNVRISVRNKRRELKLTQKVLAELAGMKQSAIARIEQGVVSPTERTVNRLAAALGCEVKELFGQES